MEALARNRHPEESGNIPITAHFDDATYHLDGSGAPPRIEPPLVRGTSREIVGEVPNSQLYPENGF